MTTCKPEAPRRRSLDRQCRFRSPCLAIQGVTCRQLNAPTRCVCCITSDLRGPVQPLLQRASIMQTPARCTTLPSDTRPRDKQTPRLRRHVCNPFTLLVYALRPETMLMESRGRARGRFRSPIGLLLVTSLWRITDAWRLAYRPAGPAARPPCR